MFSGVPLTPRMAATLTLIRVRVPGREYRTVELVPGLSEGGVERAVALAVGLVVNTFGLKSDAGRLPRRTNRRLDRCQPL